MKTQNQFEQEVREEFKKKFGEPEADNNRIAGSESCDEIIDWWLSKLRQKQEQFLKEVRECVPEELARFLLSC